ncbi:response regulator [Larkinella knui]|uniref:Response regulator n=1 Tax=Larkinella knui TaxID=2025310 RepID=A0A3P1CK92_9BACT|nr:response regulator [Larkinella knui]RRB13753.1 response regulator [Larkinella knui]
MSLVKSKTNTNRLRNARILIVEDNSDHLVLITKAIQQSFTGVESVMVTDEHAAINYLRECVQTGVRLPQLILLDLYLPERQNGWNLLKMIKSHTPEISQIPVVIFSNSDHHEDITESYDLGVTSYVVKPINYDEWVDYFQTLKDYWWETVSLPDSRSTY